MRIGYAGLYIDLPWIGAGRSEITPGPQFTRAQSFVANFWSEQDGLFFAVLAVIPRLRTDFSAEEGPIEEDIGAWRFLEDKSITDKRSVACAFGPCLAFQADGMGCAVFRRQIGPMGKPRVESYRESAGPRLYGLYCNLGAAALGGSEVDGVMRSIAME